LAEPHSGAHARAEAGPSLSSICQQMLIVQLRRPMARSSQLAETVDGALTVLDGAHRTQKKAGDSDLIDKNDLTDLAGFVEPDRPYRDAQVPAQRCDRLELAGGVEQVLR
jgi:hypothetical protein